MFSKVKKGEVAVSQNDFGLLVEEFIQNELRPGRNIESKWMDEHIRTWWPLIEKYYQQHIITAIEVALMLDNPPRYDRKELHNKPMWEKIIKDLRPARSPFKVKYHCDKCKAKGVKLWRDYQTFADHVELECAACLAPTIQVGEDGRWEDAEFGKTDQLNGKVPAIPVDDTFWGYSSVPSQDVEWWRALPTYLPKKE